MPWLPSRMRSGSTGTWRALFRRNTFRPDLAWSLIDLSVRLGDLGRREDALAAIEEAIALRRELAAARPDVFLPIWLSR